MHSKSERGRRGLEGQIDLRASRDETKRKEKEGGGAPGGGGSSHGVSDQEVACGLSCCGLGVATSEVWWVVGG